MKFLFLSIVSLCWVNSSLRNTPPTGSISAFSTSVRTVITGKFAALDAAALAGGAAGLAGVVTPGGSVGHGVAVTAFWAASFGGADCAFPSLTHRTTSRKPETG